MSQIPWLPNSPDPETAADAHTFRAAGAHYDDASTEPAAVTAFVFSLVGVLIPFVPPIVAIFLGLGAKRNIRASKGHTKGAGLATVAIVIGVTMLVIDALFVLAAYSL